MNYGKPQKEVIFPKLKEYFAQRPEVAAVYIFGSQAAGKIRQDSDIDIALLCKENAVKNPLVYTMELNTELVDLLKHKVDVVFLNSANLLLRARVFQKGILVYEKDTNARVAFQAKSIALYYDYKRYFEFHSKILKEKIKAYGLG